jgi:hypothetical protein
MSFLGTFKQRQRASQPAHIDHPVPVANRLNLPDQLRLRQVERVLQQTLQELEQAKARINQLEKELAEQDIAADGSFEQPMTPPLPIAEISKLAEMAKRLR